MSLIDLAGSEKGSVTTGKTAARFASIAMILPWWIMIMIFASRFREGSRQAGRTPPRTNMIYKPRKNF